MAIGRGIGIGTNVAARAGIGIGTNVGARAGVSIIARLRAAIRGIILLENFTVPFYLTILAILKYTFHFHTLFIFMSISRMYSELR